MLTIEIPEIEEFNEETDEIITLKKQTIQLEHSLISLSKWESKWCIHFISNKNITDEQMSDYIRTMIIKPVEISDDLFNYIIHDRKILEQIKEYIKSPMTATTFNEPENVTHGKKSSPIVTSELIYYWMVALQIPFECQKWHINRLMTLIRICQIKNEPPKKIGRKEMASRNKALNNARKSKLHTHG